MNPDFGDGATFSVTEKAEIRADAIFPEEADRRAADVYGAVAMTWIRRAWRLGLIDIIWSAEHGDWCFVYTLEQAMLRWYLPEPPGGGGPD